MVAAESLLQINPVSMPIKPFFPVSPSSVFSGGRLGGMVPTAACSRRAGGMDGDSFNHIGDLNMLSTATAELQSSSSMRSSLLHFLECWVSILNPGVQDVLATAGNGKGMAMREAPVQEDDRGSQGSYTVLMASTRSSPSAAEQRALSSPFGQSVLLSCTAAAALVPLQMDSKNPAASPELAAMAVLLGVPATQWGPTHVPCRCSSIHVWWACEAASFVEGMHASAACWSCVSV